MPNGRNVGGRDTAAQQHHTAAAHSRATAVLGIGNKKQQPTELMPNLRNRGVDREKTGTAAVLSYDTYKTARTP